MQKTVSLSALKSLVESKLKKKTLIKVMWNDNEKITLFITPNMKINSFIFDEKEGHLFYDNEGKIINYDIPCIILEKNLIDGKVLLDRLLINNNPLSKDDIASLSNLT
ncbi:hypothetical protein [Oceanobacillus halophilus]|uniref:Uncharacterized protein n=1 Tax=Oceanobacillus halophilus TaxID=930130 RepID=A0A494ZV70_9BACI|nr:hypothetical protein [Oceanobacillus halophilus]RKQ29696.1 hypothetical protein D8M06_17360 [Oceanobacillus halophilus]